MEDAAAVLKASVDDMILDRVAAQDAFIDAIAQLRIRPIDMSLIAQRVWWAIETAKVSS